VNSVRTLLIEENAQDYLEIRRLLDEQTNQLNIDWAPNYETALKKIRQKPYDLYLMGYEAKQAQQQKFLDWLSKQAVPIILLINDDDNKTVASILTEKPHIEVLPKKQLTWFLLSQSVRHLSSLITLQKKGTIFQSSFDQAFELMLLIEPNGAVQEINHKALTLMGVKRDAVIGDLLWKIHLVAHTQEGKTRIQAAAATAALGNFARCEIEIQKHDGQISTMNFLLTPITTAQNQVDQILVEGHDLHEYRHLKEQLTHTALHDQLTGLPNRHLFIELMEKAMVRARQHKNYRIALLFLDLGRIKIVDTSLGHDMGDWLFMAITERLQDCLTEKSIIGRSGCEFMILLENMQSLADATYLATTLNKVLTEPFSLGEYQIVMLTSIGIAYYTNQEEATDLLRDANIAMDQAKAMCKSCYVVFNRQMHNRALSRLQTETNIHQAIERNDFVLFYQPQIDLYSKELIGVEAFIRLRHSQNQFILPNEFLPVLEDTGVIIMLGEWILRTACSQLKSWLRAGLSINRIAVNLSAHQLRSKRLISAIKKAIEYSGLMPENLELELTKSVFLEETDSMINFLEEFKEMGIRITLDDFGVGYASLDYLRRYPIDSIKIDNSFIQGVISSPEDAAITVATIDMAQALGLTVVAEGVETVEQRDFIRDHGCNIAQGYLYAAPMEEALFLEWGKQYCQLVESR
jgi:diguanylate cyclase (GGDEF)-like protein/PAS domain S-box-containing protein